MHDLDIYAKLMAESFQDDPGVKAQFGGIQRGQKLFELYCACELDAFSKLGCVTTYGSGEGFVLGYFTKALPMEQLAQCMQESMQPLLAYATTEELAAMQQNVIEVATVIKPDWYQKFTSAENVYILQVIVVHESLRATGVFRKLITPILDAAEQQHAPVALQTHNLAHILKYEHFGFQVMETVTSGQLDLTCYNLLKA